MPDPSPILKAVCPECGAGLKTNNPNGFTPGEALECPKCQTYFAVEAPKPVKKAIVAVVDDDDEDDDRPRKAKGKKKRRRGDDDEPSGYAKYRRSPVRFILLGVLVIVLIVMAVLLWLKWDREKKENESGRGPDRIGRLDA